MTRLVLVWPLLTRMTGAESGRMLSQIADAGAYKAFDGQETKLCLCLRAIEIKAESAQRGVLAQESSEKRIIRHSPLMSLPLVVVISTSPNSGNWTSSGRHCKDSTCAVRAAPLFLVSLARPRSLVSRVSRAPRVSHPCSLLPLSHLGLIAATPSAPARVPTPPPASLISLFPLRLTTFPASLKDSPLRLALLSASRT